MTKQRGAECQQCENDGSSNEDGSCDRPPVSDTIAVRGGLAFTGNAPMSLPGYCRLRPRQSRDRHPVVRWDPTNDRVVAAVCTITTMEMMRVSGTRPANRPVGISGIASAGSVPKTSPRTVTPRLSSPISTTATVARMSPINAPGMRASIRSDRAMTARTPRPMNSVMGSLRSHARPG